MELSCRVGAFFVPTHSVMFIPRGYKKRAHLTKSPTLNKQTGSVIVIAPSRLD